MSLNKAEAIPVDTHVWQVVARDYMPHLKKHRSLTPSLHDEIGKSCIGEREDVRELFLAKLFLSVALFWHECVWSIKQ